MNRWDRLSSKALWDLRQREASHIVMDGQHHYAVSITGKERDALLGEITEMRALMRDLGLVLAHIAADYAPPEAP